MRLSRKRPKEDINITLVADREPRQEAHACQGNTTGKIEIRLPRRRLKDKVRRPPPGNL